MPSRVRCINHTISIKLGVDHLSTWPLVAQYMAQHPDMMQNVIIGLVMILFVSGGALAGLVVF